MDQEKTPQTVCKGITFLPIPTFDNVLVNFGATGDKYFPRNDLPFVPRYFIDKANSLFFNGGDIELADDIDRAAAHRYIRSMLSSFMPSHEQKERTVGYALWVWHPSSKQYRE